MVRTARGDAGQLVDVDTPARPPREPAPGAAAWRAGAGRAGPVVLAGVAIGTVEVALAASLAALIWAGPLEVYLPRAIGLGLFAAAVLLAAISLRSTFPGTIGSVQDVPAAILATVAASSAAALPAGSPRVFFTVFAAVALTTVSVGAFFWGMGRLRLGNLVRYVPYPVVGGFLGGTGVLLVVGSFGVVTGAEISLGDLSPLLQAGVLARWVPGLTFAVLLVVGAKRGWHFLYVPGLFVTSIVVFHVVLAATGGTIAQAQSGGWLLGPFPDEGLWQPWHLEAVGQVDWAAIARQVPAMATILVFSALGLLLNAGAVEVTARTDVDLDGELRAAGVANVVSGLGGGTPGYHAISLTALAFQMQARHRMVGVVASGVCVTALVVGADILALFPRFVVGGLVMFVGLMLAAEWLIDSWRRLPRAEYLVLALIVVIIATRGFVPGVVVGLAAAAVLFLISYSRVDVVKHAMTGREYRSNVDRSPADFEVLRSQGGIIHILTLHGFLFFGTANALFERVRSRTNDTTLPPLRFLVLDFRRVTGLDSSALQSFTKIRTLADREGIVIVVSGLSAPWRQLLDDSVPAGETCEPLLAMADVDHGVQWCEERILEGHDPAGHSAAADGGHHGGVFDLRALRPFVECIEAARGQVLIQEGDDSGDLFLLITGRLTVQATRADGETVRLRTIRAGSVVGELGMYLGAPRTADVVADTPSTVYRLSRSTLSELETSHPDVAAALHAGLARLMAQRITDNVHTITALLD